MQEIMKSATLNNTADQWIIRPKHNHTSDVASERGHHDDEVGTGAQPPQKTV